MTGVGRIVRKAAVGLLVLATGPALVKAGGGADGAGGFRDGEAHVGGFYGGADTRAIAIPTPGNGWTGSASAAVPVIVSESLSLALRGSQRGFAVPLTGNGTGATR
jgi:hypothetical protein